MQIILIKTTSKRLLLQVNFLEKSKKERVNSVLGSIESLNFVMALHAGMLLIEEDEKVDSGLFAVSSASASASSNQKDKKNANNFLLCAVPLQGVHVEAKIIDTVS